MSGISQRSILFSRRRRKYQIGDQSSKKIYEESVVTSWEISYKILTRFDGKFVRSNRQSSDTFAIASECICDVLRRYLRERIPPYDWSEAPVEIVWLVAGRLRCNRRASQINQPFLIAIGGCNLSRNRTTGRSQSCGRGSSQILGRRPPTNRRVPLLNGKCVGDGRKMTKILRQISNF